MPKKQSGNKKKSQSNFSKLSIFQPNKNRFKKSCPLSVKGAPTIDYKNIKLLKKYISENGLRQLEIDRQQELQRQLLKEQAIQKEKEEELRLKEEKIKAAEQERLRNEKEQREKEEELRKEEEKQKKIEEERQLALKAKIEEEDLGHYV